MVRCFKFYFFNPSWTRVNSPSTHETRVTKTVTCESTRLLLYIFFSIFHFVFNADMKGTDFRWLDYLKQTKSAAAPVKLFNRVSLLHICLLFFIKGISLFSKKTNNIMKCCTLHFLIFHDVVRCQIISALCIILVFLVIVF